MNRALLFQWRLLAPSLRGANNRLSPLLLQSPRNFSTLLPSSSQSLLFQRASPLRSPQQQQQQLQHWVRWSSTLEETNDDQQVMALNKKIVSCSTFGGKKETRNPLERATEYLEEIGGLGPNGYTTQALLSCGRAASNWSNTTREQWKKMKEVLEKVVPEERDQKWLQSMVMASVGLGDLETALKYYNLLKESCENGVVPKSVLGDLLRGYASKGDLEQAVVFYDILKEHYTPGKQTMEHLLKAAFAESNWEKMEHFFEEMTGSLGLQPNHNILGLMIEGCMIAGSPGNALQKALKYVSILNEQQMLPNLRIHQALHKCALVSKNLDKKLWEGLNNVWADSVELACIAAGGASFSANQALAVFTRLREEGQRLPPNVLNSLMSNFANIGQSKVVDALYEEFKELGYKPIRFTLQSLVRAGKKGQDWEMMEDRYHEITEKFGVKPTFATLNNMIEGCALKGPTGMDSPVAMADKFLKEIKEMGKKPNLATYHALSRCAQKGTPISAMEDQWALNKVFNEVKESGSYKFEKVEEEGEKGEGEKEEGGEEEERQQGRKDEGERRRRIPAREGRPLMADD